MKVMVNDSDDNSLMLFSVASFGCITNENAETAVDFIFFYSTDDDYVEVYPEENRRMTVNDYNSMCRSLFSSGRLDLSRYPAAINPSDEEEDY